MKLLRTAWHLILIALAVLYAVSCTATVGADGAKSFSLDGTQALRAIEILSDK